jgi:hypothetical protein
VEFAGKVSVQKNEAKDAYCMHPQRVGFPFATTDGPFTSISTNGVFQFRLNLILEAVEVSSHAQFARVKDIVVKAEIPPNSLAIKEYINLANEKVKNFSKEIMNYQNEHVLIS